MQGLMTQEAKVLFFMVKMLFDGFLDVRLEQHSPDWCRKKFVGRVRSRLEPLPGVATISGARTDAKQMALLMLKEHCAECRRCGLGSPP